MAEEQVQVLRHRVLRARALASAFREILGSSVRMEVVQASCVGFGSSLDGSGEFGLERCVGFGSSLDGSGVYGLERADI